MGDRLTVISCIISSPDSMTAADGKPYLQPGPIVARLGVSCQDYGVSVISVVLRGAQNQISSLAGDLGKVDGIKVKPIRVPVNK